MFFGRQVLQGVIGLPVVAAGGATYNWIFVAGVGSSTARYTLDTYTETSQGTVSGGGTGNPASYGNESYGWCIAGYNESATYVNRWTNASLSTNSQQMTALSSSAQQNGIGGGCYKTGQTGYTFGGTGGGAWTNLILKHNIGADTWSTAGTALAAQAGWPGVHNNGTYALISGGYNGVNRNENNVFAFASDTKTNTTTLATATRDWNATGDQTNFYGYCGTDSTVGISTIRKLAIASGTQATTFTNSSALRYGEGAGSDTTGLFTGGEGATTLVREITYSSDTFATKTALSSARVEHGSWSGAQTA